MAVAKRVRVYNPGRKKKTVRRKRRNVGELVTISIPNSGRKKTMARARRRKTTAKRRNTTRRTTRRKASNAGKVVYRYRTRKRSTGRGKRRNTGVLTGRAGQVFGIIGGATVTGLLCNTVVPLQFRMGFVGYFSTAAVAMLQGAAVGKFGRNAQLGKNMTVGGFVYLALKVMGDLLPGVSGSIPIGLRGLGVLAPGSRGNPILPTSYAPNSMMRVIGPSYASPAPASNGMGLAQLRAARGGRMG